MMEYWAHEACFIRPEHFHDLVQWQNRKWVGAHAMDPELRNGVAAQVLETLAAGKPMTAAELTARLGHVEDRQRDNWGWNWNAVKRVLEHLFEEGLVSASSRTESFERRYTLTARVLPGPGGDAAAPEPDAAAAMDRLIDAAARAHGIGTVRCFADYFRTPQKAAAVAVRNLVDSRPAATGHGGRLESAPVPSRGGETSALSHRPGAAEPLRLPGVRTPAARGAVRIPLPDRDLHARAEARYGYYVLPFLLRDAIVARVDLKADRSGGRLLVQDRPCGSRRAGGHRRRTRRGTAAHGRVAGTGRGSCLANGEPCAGARRSRGCPVDRTYPL